MKILQVLPYFSPRMGGPVQIVNNLSNTLVDRGHDVVLLTTDYYLWESEVTELDYRVIIFKNWFSRMNFYLSPGMFAWQMKNIRSFDVIHLHDYRTFQNIFTSYLSRKFKIPYIISPHGSILYNNKYQFLKRIYDLVFGKYILSGAEVIIGNSPREYQQIRSKGICDDKINLLYNGIDITEFEDYGQVGGFKKMIGVGDDTKMVLCLGRIISYKGFDLVIKAFSHVVKKYPECILVIVGQDEGYMGDLKKIVEEFNLSGKVYFPGPLYGEEKIAAYQAADVFVHSSMIESFGLVVIEALMCDSPVIVADSVGVCDLILEYNAGVVVPFGDVKVLANAINERLNDLEGNEYMVKNGQKMSRDLLNWANVAQQTEKIYQQVIQQN